jgi:NH3-dependent NAD+ synthetase
MVGFWTLHGDVGDFGLIQNLWKTDVYDLSKWIQDKSMGIQADALKACIEATPTDGLGITNSDLDQLGASTYNEVDKILKTWLTKDLDSFSWDDFLVYPGREINTEEFFKYRESF